MQLLSRRDVGLFSLSRRSSNDWKLCTHAVHGPLIASSKSRSTDPELLGCHYQSESVTSGTESRVFDTQSLLFIVGRQDAHTSISYQYDGLSFDRSTADKMSKLPFTQTMDIAFVAQ